MNNVGGVDAYVTLLYQQVDGIQFAKGIAALHVKDLGQPGGDIKINAYHHKRIQNTSDFCMN